MQVLKRGFTLVELLVVISIIGILVGVVAVNANTARRQSRDAKRKADLQNVAGALELYRTTKHTYPTGVTYGASLRTALDAFTSNVPSDPSAGVANDGNYANGGYYYASDGTRFVLDARLENAAETPTISIANPTSPAATGFYQTGTYTDSSGKAHYRVAGP